MRTSHWYRAAMAAAMTIVLLNTWLAVRALHTLFETEGWRSHTLEVLTHTEELALEVKTADSAVRGYLLTGQPAFEARYRTAVQGIYQEVDQVQRLTVDNETQRQRLAYLRTRVANKLGSLDMGINIRKQTSGLFETPVLLQPVLGETSDGGPTVFYVVTQIEAEEQRLLVERTRETARAHLVVWASFIGASVLDILLLIAAFQLLIKTDRNRVRLAADATKIATLNADLTNLNADLESRVDQRTRELAISNQELEAFSYSVSHDLRAPLRTIDGFSLALQEDFSDKLNDEGRDYITRVRNGVQRMGTLIDALLQLSRVTRSDIQQDQVDLSQLATLVFHELEAGDPGREVLFVAQPGVLVEGDSRLLRIALENLMGNAWKFTSKTVGARLEFGSSSREGRPVYFIRDNGAGFDMQYVDRLFTAFQRLHGDRDFKGSGIGLATVSRIIRRHHGEIWAKSEVGHGATFYFTLAA